ncbi:MAG: hypothetical protein GYA62_02295, partial [Bacteroidales bacterium]|nr:hypothetical protein [Bacteroidales bacterium]
MKVHRIIFILFFTSSFSFLAIGQDLAKKEIEKQAEKNWNNLNYKLAAEQYEKLLSLDPQDVNYAYRFAVSNFIAGFKVDKSLKYLEPLMGKEKVPTDIPFWIGKMYMANYQFNDAIDMFNTFIAGSGISQDPISEAQKNINMCLSAIQLLNKPINIAFENLGPNINSTANDFLPLVPENEDFLIFTSDKRFDEASQTFDENIYISYPEKNGWTLSKPLSYLNTFDPEKAVGLSSDGKTLYVCGHFANSYSDINIATQKNKQFKLDQL